MSQESRRKAGLIKVGSKIKIGKGKRKAWQSPITFCLSTQTQPGENPSLTRKNTITNKWFHVKWRERQWHSGSKAGLIFHQLSKHDHRKILCKCVKTGWIVWQKLVNMRKEQRETANRVSSKSSVLSQTP